MTNLNSLIEKFKKKVTPLFSDVPQLESFVRELEEDANHLIETTKNNLKEVTLIHKQNMEKANTSLEKEIANYELEKYKTTVI